MNLNEIKKAINKVYFIIEKECYQNNKFILSDIELNTIISHLNDILIKNKYEKILKDVLNEDIVLKMCVFAHIKYFLNNISNEQQKVKSYLNIGFINQLKFDTDFGKKYQKQLILNYVYLIFRDMNKKDFMKEISKKEKDYSEEITDLNVILRNMNVEESIYDIAFISKIIFFNIKPFFQYIDKYIKNEKNYIYTTSNFNGKELIAKIQNNTFEFYIYLDDYGRKMINKLISFDYIDSIERIILRKYRYKIMYLIYKFILKKEYKPNRNFYISNEYQNFADYLLYGLI